MEISKRTLVHDGRRVFLELRPGRAMFMPIRFAAVTFLISVASPHVSLAQVAETLPLGISPAEDSSALKAVRKGSDAAESVWVSGRFYSAFLGSASIGAAVKLYSFDQDMKFGSIFLGGVGVALLVGRPRSIVPPPEADAVNGSLPDAPGLSTLYREAYYSRLRERRKRAAAWGIFTGTIFGTSATYLILSRLLET